jgi:hypothetical protein
MIKSKKECALKIKANTFESNVKSRQCVKDTQNIQIFDNSFNDCENLCFWRNQALTYYNIANFLDIIAYV